MPVMVTRGLPYAVAAPTGAPFATSVSANSRNILDQFGQPWLMVGDSGWGGMVGLSTSDWATYVTTRAGQGLNCILAELVSDQYSAIAVNNAQTFDGINAFTGTVAGPYPDLSTPNPTYWSRMDTMITTAATNGITMMLVPADCANVAGATGSPSHNMSMVRANGATACVNYGKFLGNRYKSFNNVIWMHGNDYESDNFSLGTDDQYVGGIADGIRTAAPSMLQTVEITQGISTTAYSNQGTNWTSRINLDQAYPGTSDPTAPTGISAYASSPTSPAFLGEGFYDGTGGGSNNQLRRQAWWTMVTGCYGYMYGHLQVYGFGTGWQSDLSTTAITQLGYWKSFWTGVAWQTLVPDTGNTFLTSGFGSGTSKAYGAVAADGTLGVVYAPANGPVVLDMTKMRGTALCRWFDPTLGTFSTIGSFSNTGTHSFTNPSAHGDGTDDYALVLTA